MTTDVATNADTGNPIKHGVVTTSMQKTGVGFGTLVDRVTPNPADVEDLETKLTDRFDDPQYYSA